MAVNYLSNKAQEVMGDKPTAISPGYEAAPSGETMEALTWHGVRDVRMATVPKPTVSDANDAVIRITGSTVCGSDLHLYHGEILQLKQGDVLGHEAIGVVEQVGDAVRTIKVGDRVVCSFSISCGQCDMCKRDLGSMCDVVNKSSVMDKLYGKKIGGVLGYGHFLGGFAGAQSEAMRMPFADRNCFKVPDSLPDEKALYLSDIVCTSYHSVVDVDFQPGETAAIWGAGPIGLNLCQWLKPDLFNAKKVILVDNDVHRLAFARDRFGVETINFDEVKDVAAAIQELVPIGVDVSFDAAGFRYAKTALHKAMRAVALETDSPEVLNEAIRATRKFGKISIAADYAGTTNGFLIGALMERGIQLKGNGQAPTQRYIPKLMKEYLEPGRFDPTIILTHRFKLEDTAEIYAAFDEKRFDESKGVGLLKCFVETKHSFPRAEGTPELSKIPERT
ncbi:uncharacterized protein PFL1_05438 [Pseudozyma flocculosa PF-1]|uniref:Uncharacterized protein n=2 Tax=Pseudozyma flocculosa TaxID=84751 RepID=A0A061H321_9BASI|nr:uncharacterized protein PFL1_05438 [Pseudozyma flocculosa PF-1]EPQ27157.1 hypothetical protein PFL1_05438 [Pseudozyma flocculosa PF-1]SPO41262.1 probable glutathione-dependent formaldehyde dehydrogenase [Pseudozyma flocculosa]